jgi:hypothetical protein
MEFLSGMSACQPRHTNLYKIGVIIHSFYLISVGCASAHRRRGAENSSKPAERHFDFDALVCDQFIYYVNVYN